MDFLRGQKMEEDPLEAQGREKANFARVETMLFEKLTKAGVSSISSTAALKLPGAAIEGLFGWLGIKNPLIRNARADRNEVWILDNTAFKASNSAAWEAEFVTAFFQHGRGDLTMAAAAIVDAVGLDGNPGADKDKKAIIEERLKPFVDAIAPARTLPVVIQPQGGETTHQILGPSNTNGISSQILEVADSSQQDGATIRVKSDTGVRHLPKATGVTRLVGPEGWAVISDIDDTIKITQTPDPVGILRTTFTEPAQFTSHMPEFYKILEEQLQKPAWFYLSASPYNLYPFLHQFISDYFPPGTIILRDASWQTLGGLLSSLTQGVKEYKSSRIDKIHGWLPDRKVICVGDSTQMDPETYAAMYRKHPGWIKAIYIRKVLDAPFMEEKNQPERFEKAFEGIPQQVWKVFVLPDELKDHVATMVGEQHQGVLSTLSSFFCGEQREHQQLEQDKVKH
ncbi:hypothetical protein LTS08_001856 [Lithohypha guttulata]|nr:hypothetical protein LTS08_001856 [Lithohypha guttulata]